MKKMKYVVVILLLVVLMLGSYLGYQVYFGGVPYYTKIQDNGKKMDMGMMGSDQEFIDYEYSQLAYDKEGHEKQVDFIGAIGRPLKKNAYLKVTVNKKKGVVRWEEVDLGDIPDKAQAPLK